ncbi:MAG: RNA-binding protein [Candidatus Aenigmarchaeota archaeon]|nr:RNA-binding protein [Candidatus Aenigmarchaeota archaeon]
MEENNNESKLFVEDRKIVVPGEVLAKGIEYLPGHDTYKINNEIRSKILGLVKIKNHLINVVPLSGGYMPQERDGVIGEVVDIQPYAWLVNINSPYLGYLSLSEGVEEFVDLAKSDLTEYFDVGDVIYAKIKKVTKRKDVLLTMKDKMCRKLRGGTIIRITPAKVPRLIGKGGSMVETIKEKTGCKIIIGQNGFVWISGKNISAAAKAVLMVERESHTTGLTERIGKLLEKELSNVDKGDENE